MTSNPGDMRGRGRIGLLVPFTNTNLEPDMVALAPPGVTVHTTRLGGYDADEIPDARQMAGLGAADLDEPLGLIGGVRPDVILYGCTSATLAHGAGFDRDLAARAARIACAPVVTAAGAVVGALAALGIRRIGLASPYVAALNDRAVAFLAVCGVETVGRGEPERPLSNDEQGALTPDDVVDLARRADRPEAEGLLLSCTDMRSVEAVDRIEQMVGKPVVTSNQALMFAALPHLGLPTTAVRCGRLFELRPAA